MYSNLAEWLEKTRTDCGLTLSNLAEVTGLRHSTLWRLERGLTRPTTFTLTALFKAFASSADEQQEILALGIERRNLKVLSSTGKRKAPQWGIPPPDDQGTVIRQLRERSGFSQAALARKVAQSQPKISDWEQLKSSPSSEDRTKLIQALSPPPLEEFVLQSGQLVVLPQILTQRFLDNCAHDLHELIRSIERGDRIPDGRFLLLEHRLRRLTGIFATAWGQLLQAYAWHGEYLIRWSRCDEMSTYARLAMDLIQTECQDDPQKWRAVSLMARSLAEVDPKSGFVFINDYASSITQRLGTVSLLRDAADYGHRAGATKQGDYLMQQVRRLSRNASEEDAYRMAHADKLRLQGRPEAALTLLSADITTCPFLRLTSIGLRAHLYLDLSENQVALTKLQEYHALADHYQFPHLRDNFNWIATRLLT